MSLKDKIKQPRISFKEVRLVDPQGVPPTPPGDTPPSPEDEVYNRMRDKNPLLDDLVSSLQLELTNISESHTAPTGEVKSQLRAIAKKILKPYQGEQGPQIIAKIGGLTGVNRYRAEGGLKLMEEARIVKRKEGKYYLVI